MKSSLQTIFHIVRKEFLQVRQDKRMMIVSVMVPVVQVLLLGYAATVDVNNIDMVVCDLDKTAVSREFVRSFVNSRYFIHRYDVNDHNAVDEYIAYGKARIALVIPPGFGEKIERFRCAGCLHPEDRRHHHCRPARRMGNAHRRRSQID